MVWLRFLDSRLYLTSGLLFIFSKKIASVFSINHELYLSIFYLNELFKQIISWKCL
jgi:hypothetical protein